MHTLAIDIETYSSYDLNKSGVYKYVEAPDFEILLFAYSVDGGDVQIVDFVNFEDLPGGIMRALTDASVLKTAFNANFEITALSKYFKRKLDNRQWECTMVKSAMLGLPMGLDQVSKVLKLEQGKDAKGKALIKYFSVPCKPSKVNGGRTRNMPEHAPDKWQQFKDYCAQDVVVEQSIRNKLDFFPIPETEKKLWQLDQRINDRGVLLDPVFVENAIKLDTIYRQKLTQEITELTNLDNPNSPAQLKEWLSEETGSEVTSLTKEAVPLLLEKTDSETVTRALEIRQEMSKTSVKKYEAMTKCICADNRVRGLLQFGGASRTMRWAGRLIQVQNLPQNHLPDLDLARKLVREGNLFLLEMLFGNVPDTLSQLIRTAFIAPEGSRFIVADFSAIEARVIAWLAGEKWRMDVFNTHGKIYEASAAQMFKVPIETVVKGSPLRQKGKVAELALGYQGGVGALVQMGALKMGLMEDELPGLVSAWRSSNPAIVRLWKSVEVAAISAVEGNPCVIAHNIKFSMCKGMLLITLPSGRSLCYQKATLKPNKFGGESLVYWGMNQTTRQWQRVDTYGGKLVENCFAQYTEVLSSEGWIKITEVTKETVLWDGVEWVSCDGIISKGEQQTITINGVRMTPEQKILTNHGWQNASSCEGLNRAEVQLPHRNFLRRIKREKIKMACGVRLRKKNYKRSLRIKETEDSIMRLQTQGANRLSHQNTRDERSSNICGVEVNDRQVSVANSSSVAQLRRSGNKSLSKVESILQLLGGYGTDLSKGTFAGKSRCERQLRKEKLHLGYYEKADEEQKMQCADKHTMGQNNGRRSVRAFRDRFNYNFLQDKTALAGKPFTISAGRYEQVYDIINSGCRNRFVVRGSDAPFIVHNCVQAIARDCLADAMLRLDAAGYKICMHVHDETIVEVPNNEGSLEEVNKIMGQPISWAKGLPLTADGYETNYYKKD